MAKFKKSEMKKSLLEGISLVYIDYDNYKWVEFHEIAACYDDGYILFNEEKRAYYEKL